MSDSEWEQIVQRNASREKKRRRSSGGGDIDVNGMKEVRGEISDLKVSVDAMMELLKTMMKKVERMESRFEKLEETTMKQGEEMAGLKSGMNVMERKFVQVEEKWKEMEDRVIDQEARGRRNNLVFHGLAEREGESWDDSKKVLANLITNELGIKDRVVIERAHRLGSRPTGARASKPRPLIARFLDFNDRERVKAARRNLPRDVRVTEDLPWQIRQARRQLSDDLEAAKQASQNAWVTYPARLMVDGHERRSVRPADMKREERQPRREDTSRFERDPRLRQTQTDGQRGARRGGARGAWSGGR